MHTQKHHGDSQSLFTARQFIHHFAPHLKETRFPSVCILSLIPQIGRYVQNASFKTAPFIFSHSYYTALSKDPDYVLVYAGLGASVAGISLEVCIELGVEKFLILGTCGLLNPEIQSGEIIIPTQFISEEGVSPHYVRSSEKIHLDDMSVDILLRVMNKNKIPAYHGLHWTTSAPFRETGAKVESYRARGCHSVDMELSALCAISQFYRKKTGALLIGSDRFTESGWKPPRPSFNVVTKRFSQLLTLCPDMISEF